MLREATAAKLYGDQTDGQYQTNNISLIGSGKSIERYD